MSEAADRDTEAADGSDRESGGPDAMIDVDFGEDGLVPAIAQDVDSGEVLMLAYVTEEALDRTLETGEAHYYSRSREELWHKGGTSGHTQDIAEVRVDCDADTLLYLVDQTGGACHTGHRSCFHRTVEGEHVGERVFDPDEVY
ncbi:phosphoribosyl-AMP cyclohydrolase [Halopenitus malekzadehii]|uniref:Phosphoribosyl-AMP cyclohydrolase n=2 Tax=Halopenitus malekzadehii TaxID=1267564 RepID=A0A1H6ISY1_9EURY|nr:phosphoribosyl-AMP cyclohydrolase [Halopenitus malekzadehii]